MPTASPDAGRERAVGIALAAVAENMEGARIGERLLQKIEYVAMGFCRLARTRRNRHM